MKTTSENQRIRAVILPQLVKRKREILLFLIIPNLLLGWLYFSGINDYNKTLVLIIVIIVNLITYYHSSFRDFEKALTLPSRKTNVSFCTQRMHKGQVIMAEISLSDGESKKYHCRMTNISTHYLDSELTFVVFEKNGSPKLIFNEEKLLFAVI